MNTEHDAVGGKLVVLGLGYVGLPLALAAADAGHHVLGYDISESRVDDLRAGRSCLVDVDDEALLAHLGAGTLSVTADPSGLAGWDTYVICVPTPLLDGGPDLSMVLAAADLVATCLTPGDLVILESTTWPGTTRDVLAPRLRERTGLVPGEDFHLVFSPERIDPGNQDFPLTRIPKLVGGMTRADSERAAAFYRTFIDTVHVVSGPSEAEMAKILENTFRHVNLALVNELAVLCRETGVDLQEAIDAAATKPFGFMPFYPGPGVGGHCIPVDPVYLTWHARNAGRTLRLVELAQQINRDMPRHVVARVTDVLNNAGKPVRRSRVLILGVSYKPGVADLRESPAIPIAETLGRLGAEVSWHDPFVPEDQDLFGPRRITELTESVVDDHDLTLLHTAHSCYVPADLARGDRLLLDARTVLDPVPSHD
ncbi:nucleotide sugar dehydrogenase [Lentzea sp.]|uniref:nucleotide sugar dehydrogenase n=1 Tax=Lentzea sp. TaxID=56099 RepID=UPI002B903FB9|nr:nucleotide sugar dehydrogenase [Lentzea sp.]HUQ56453.1 nucleotide sugar dehydrogenase [Lentzea sp.]